MSLTLTAEPAVIDGARSYAERSGMTLEAFVLAYLEATAKRERERRECERRERPRPAFLDVRYRLSDEGASELMTAQEEAKTPNEKLMELAGTWVSDPEEEKVFEEMRTIDEEMWK